MQVCYARFISKPFACCRHAQRLLKYGFDLGPQFSTDTNLPPDEGDSVPATVRRNAPSNVILNIADLRSSMHEAALGNDDDADLDGLAGDDQTAGIEGDTYATQRLHQLSPEEQQHMPPPERPQSPGDPSSDKYHQGGMGDLQATSWSTGCSQVGPNGMQSTPDADLHNLNAPQDAYVASLQPHADAQQPGGNAEQSTRGLSALRGTRSRPQLASVHFAEESNEDIWPYEHGALSVTPGRTAVCTPPPDPGVDS